MPPPNNSMPLVRLTFRIFTVILVFAVALGGAEVFLRIKNSSMRNYDIEMWRYSKELKQPTTDPDLGFTHIPSRTAILESVMIRLNEAGLRGGPIEPLPSGGRRILVIGGSSTLGWGVTEENTLTVRLESLLRASGETVQVLNGGVANYNAKRYVARFFKELVLLNSTDIVVHFFHRDAEELLPDRPNEILRHSQLAYTMWLAVDRLINRSSGESLVDHYQRTFDPKSPGFISMRANLKKLANFAKERGVRIYLAASPDTRDLVGPKLRFVHEAMAQVAVESGYTFIDLLPALEGLPPEKIFVMPGDPHPNALGHDLMAKVIFHAIKRL